MLYELHIHPHGRPDFDLVVIGDGTVKTWGVCTAFVTCQNRTRPCPIWAGEEDTDVILGATSLEILGFKVDPVNQILEPVSPRG